MFLEDKYNQLENSCIETGKTLLPKRPKPSLKNLSKSESVVEARGSLTAHARQGIMNNVVSDIRKNQ